MPPPLPPRISYSVYYKIFNTEFNLSFGQPRSDTCARCDELHIALQAASGEKKEQLKAEQIEHHSKASAGYSTKQLDKKAAITSWRDKRRVVGGQTFRSKDGVDMMTFDFEQNLPTPTLNHNDMFYARQLWTYNFGIHDCVSNQVDNH